MQKLNSTDFHLPYNPQLIARAKELRQNPTPAEKKLWQSCLRAFPLRVLRQRPIDHFIVNFYCAALKLVIEIDGESHFIDEAHAYDAERSPHATISAGVTFSVLSLSAAVLWLN